MDFKTLNERKEEMFSLSLRIGKHLTKSEADRLSSAISEEAVVFDTDSFSKELIENIVRDYRSFGQNFVYGNPLLREGRQYLKETYEKSQESPRPLDVG